MFFVYVLYSNKLKKRYVGYTSNIAKRFEEHNSGKSKFTKGGIPWVVVYKESFSTKSDAQKSEKFLKSGVGRKKIDELLSRLKFN